jgi:hypothetical protein
MEERGGPKRWNRGGPGLADSESGFREAPDRERCTRT